MKLIIFQGNPGVKYRKTRHNIGWIVADEIAKNRGIKWRSLLKFGARVTDFTVNNERIILVKPQKFYNLTGEVVQNLTKFYKLAPSNLLVVCDDLNLPFGTIRVRQKGSDGGNNGLKSVIQALGMDGFTRIRIGIDNELRVKIGDVDFVTSKFSRDEAKQLPEIIDSVIKKIDESIDK